jgi:hypothetical protein
MLKEVVEFLLIRSKFLPRHVSAYVCHLQGSWVPDKLLKQCSVLWACADYDPSRAASCSDDFHLNGILDFPPFGVHCIEFLPVIFPIMGLLPFPAPFVILCLPLTVVRSCTLSM